MTWRVKIVVGAVTLSAVVLAGSAIAQATNSHTAKEQRVKAVPPASALHSQVGAAKSAKVLESRLGTTLAQAQTATQDSRAETEQPKAVGVEAADDNFPDANDDSAIENEPADDEQGELENAAADDQDDDSSQADVQDDDDDNDSSGPSDDVSQEDQDDDTGDD